MGIKKPFTAPIGVDLDNTKIINVASPTDSGDGVNKSFSINASNITTGTLAVANGGTGQSSYTTGDLVYATAATTLSKLSVGASGTILTSSGSAPQWSAASGLSVGTATNATNATTTTNLDGGAGGSLPYQSATGTTTFLSIGTANRVLTSSGTAPQWVTSLTGLTGLSSSAITNTALTSGRVVYSTTSGAQTDSANLTFDGTTLTAAAFSGPFNGAIGATTPNTGSFTTLNASGTVTLSGGTANGVLYLNGSKVATSGAALTFDGTTLNFGSTAQRITGDMSNATIANRLFFQTNVSNGNTSISVMPNGTSGVSAVSCYNNSDPTNASFVGLVTTTSTVRVQSTVSGTGTYLPLTIFTGGSEAARFDTSGNFGLRVTPSAWSTQTSVLENPSGAIYSFTTSNQIGINSNAYYNGTNWIYRNNSSVAVGDYYIQNGLHVWRRAAEGTAGNIITYTEQMRLNSTGLGIGTNAPAAKLSVNGNQLLIGGGDVSIPALTTTLVSNEVSSNASGNGTSDYGFLRLSAGGGTTLGNKTAIDLQGYGTTDNSQIRLYTSGTQRAVIDASGNLGLGGTPSAWSGYNAFQIGDDGSTPLAYIASDAAGNTVTNIGHGAYWNGSNWLYTSTSVGATRYQMTGANAGSTHAWFVSAGGTAGNTISFTQAMTLSTLGRLGVGTTNPIGFVTVSNAGAEGLELYPNGAISGGPYINAYNRSSASYIHFTMYATSHTWYSGASAGTRAVDLDTDGNLLINTTSTGAAGLGISNVKNLTFAEGSGASYANLFRQSSSAATILANGYKWSSTSNGFASSIGTSWAKSAIALNNGEAVFYADAAATVANGTDATPTERLRVKSTGQTRFQPLASDPSNAENGDVYYNSTTNKLRVYAGGAWADLH